MSWSKLFAHSYYYRIINNITCFLTFRTFANLYCTCTGLICKSVFCHKLITNIARPLFDLESCQKQRPPKSWKTSSHPESTHTPGSVCRFGVGRFQKYGPRNVHVLILYMTLYNVMHFESSPQWWTILNRVLVLTAATKWARAGEKNGWSMTFHRNNFW